MTESEAQEVLREQDLVEVIVAPLQDIKRMREQCLAAEIPAAMKRPCSKGGG